MTELVKDLKIKIIKREGLEAELISLSTVARVVGYSNSTPVLLKSYEAGLNPVKIGNKYKIKKSELERLLAALIVADS